MENQDKIYKQFKDAAGKAEQKDFARMDAVWNRVEEKLDNKKQRTIASLWKYTAMAAVFLLFMGVGIFMLNNEKNNPAVAPTVTPENNVTAIDTQKVKETFDPSKTDDVKAFVTTEKTERQSGSANGIASGTDAITLSEPNEAEGDINKSYETASPAGDISTAYVQEADKQSAKEKMQPVAKPAVVTTAEPVNNAVAATNSPVTIETKPFSGVITDSQGLPIPGVNVVVAGTQQGTQTDFDGKYMIDAKEGEKLIASFIGMQTQTVTLGKRKDNINLKLADDAQSLQEVVVEAYRTSTRATSNVAVTTVTSKTIANRPSRAERKKAKKEAEMASKPGSTSTDIGTNSTSTGDNYVLFSPKNTALPITTTNSKTIEGRPNANYIQTLQGQVPGLTISTASGQPGTDTTVILRGYGSMNSTIEPLYVIDGVPLNADNFKSIKTDDIESISVLKDASATSIYGNRGSNGVIIVKTKNAPAKQQALPITTEEEPDEDREIEIDDSEDGSFMENQFENTSMTPLSTFSIDVDNASYTNIRRYLNDGETVPKDEVRVEEMINFFKYQYPQPVNNEPFSINTEYSDAPWNPQHKLLRIGLQGKTIADDNLPASNFVFLIDVSGSMEDDEKLPLLKQSMKLLVNQMRKKDKIAIVVYAGAAGLVLPPTSGDQKETIIAALDNLEAGGSTAGGEGIELAYKTAQENFVKKGNNRVILATDGDFNVGPSSDDDMETLIEEKRKSGVFLTCLGYGMGNYKDSKMEILADKGNGNYAYIDSMQEADRYLNKEFKGSMYAIAKDVKIQIEFNPKYVQSYRLIGYENRKLRDEDFANDAIDAGELGSGHTVTALYEIIPVGIKSEYFNPSPDLKYSQPTSAANQYNDELATIKFRSKKPDGNKSTEIVKIIPNNPVPLQSTSGDYKFSASVAWFGLKLRDSKLVPNKKTDDIKSLAKQGLQNDTDGYKSEFVRLVDLVK